MNTDIYNSIYIEFAILRNKQNIKYIQIFINEYIIKIILNYIFYFTIIKRYIPISYKIMLLRLQFLVKKLESLAIPNIYFSVSFNNNIY